MLAADGGGTKTDVALVAADGRVLGHARGGPSQVHYIGVDGAITVLQGLLVQAARACGLDPHALPAAATTQLLLSGIDLPEERSALRAAMVDVGWSRELAIGNDTDAVLRSGTDRGWGVGVVCGTGINCVGVAPDGREARFLSFGEISGDWGGGPDLAVAAVAAAVRGVDGRGPRTELETALPEHFGERGPLQLAQAFHLGKLSQERLGELAPLVFALRDCDPVAAQIVQRQVDEIVTYVRAALTRLELLETDPDVILGGGVHRGVDSGVISSITVGITTFAPHANVTVAPSEPIVGAALMGLDALRSDWRAHARARAELDATLSRI